MNAITKTVRTACLVATSVAVLSTSALAIDWETGGMALRVISNLKKDDIQATKMEGAHASYILFTPHTEKLFNRYVSVAKLTDNNGYLQVDNPAEYSVTKYRGQCVSFVRAFSTKPGLPINKGSKDITPQTKVPLGTVIATFDSKGDYHGHIAVVLKISNEGVYVIDQNWDTHNRVAVHIIKFKQPKEKNTTGVDVRNAYHYSTVQ